MANSLSQLTIRRYAAFRAAPLSSGRPFAGSLQRRGRSASLRGPGELFNPEACETGGLGLTVSRGGIRRGRSDSYLVDPASSHMLVSKIKPCMSKYKQICTVKLRMAH